MSRSTDAPAGFECPCRHKCPHLDTLSTTWVMECYQEGFDLRMQLHRMEEESRQRIEELEKALLERDRKVAQLQVQHRKQFKANQPAAAAAGPVKVKVKRRGAPVGHPGWQRRPPDHVDQVVPVAAPVQCPHCQSEGLTPWPHAYEHVQEDIVLVPRTRVVKFVHQQCCCGKCRREVYQTAPGELRGCDIGPVTRAVAIHLRYQLQIPYDKVQHVLADLFGMPLAPATVMAFDRQATALGRPLYEELRAMVRSAEVDYADETSWRQDGRTLYLWYAGNEGLAFHQIADRSLDSARRLLGEQFDGTVVSDDYSVYDALGAKHQQTCWRHLDAKAKEIQQQIEPAAPDAPAPKAKEIQRRIGPAAPDAPAPKAKEIQRRIGPAAPDAPAPKAKEIQRRIGPAAPKALAFCGKLRDFAGTIYDLGRQQRDGKLGPRKAMVPKLQRRLRRFASRPLDHPEAETLRKRIVEKDRDKLFTVLKVKGAEPTNNQAERSLRFMVIMRKICFGTRSDEGAESHGVLPSLLETAKRQGKESVQFLIALLTKPLAAARAALFANAPPAPAPSS